MNRNSGMTLAQTGLLVFGIMLFLAVLLPSLKRETSGVHHHVRCSDALRAQFRAMNSYAQNYKGIFPIAGESGADPGSPARGFDPKLPRYEQPMVFNPAALRNNATASLWLLIRDQSLKTKFFVCSSTEDEPDPLTLDGKEDGKPVPPAGTGDFFARKNLSYSMINMYHPQARKNWSARANPDWILMGENNNADQAPRLHQLTKATSAITESDIQLNENSRNHMNEGQHFLFGDSSVVFKVDPFVGPGGDNVYADDKAAGEGDPEEAAPPMMSTNRPQANPGRNVVLLPLSGNNGVNLDPNGEEEGER